MSNRRHGAVNFSDEMGSPMASLLMGVNDAFPRLSLATASAHGNRPRPVMNRAVEFVGVAADIVRTRRRSIVEVPTLVRRRRH